MRRMVYTVLVALLTAVPVRGGDSIRWNHSLEQAMAEARQQSKYVFVDVYADWCQYCHVLDREVYTDLRVVRYLKPFVAAKVDSEEPKHGAPLLDRYQVDGLPAMLVLDSGGKLILRMIGFRKADALISEMDHFFRLLEREKATPDDPDISFRLGEEYHSRLMLAEAEPRWIKFLSSPHVTPERREKALFSAAQCEYFLNRKERALSHLEEYYRSFQGKPFEEQALLLLAQIHVENNANEAARKVLIEFLDRYPGSENTGKARVVLRTIEKRIAAAAF